ncbi:hypothetical protein J27TS8_13490 [Robertmurraya siralis]|uniref:Uncharacterized protein n=1 Tax=Robertmurraya siralis TaxID=77777 RepID=A0A920BT72_9BACI|nr:hypothetical protein J27TS8_13490 [Robertmurraya siralis]
MRKITITSYNKDKKYITGEIYLYFGQGSYNIGSKEMIHNVKEAEEKACSTLERFASKKIHRVN